MFERTVAGQQNRALFYNANFTCYVEGDNSGSRDSRDGTFWKKVFKAFRPELKVIFLPRGGKPVLESLAHDVIGNDIKNVLVAMDADYDRLAGELIDDGRVLYTFGYSWENDVFHRGAVPGVIAAILHKENLPASLLASIDAEFDKLDLRSKRAIISDALALMAGSSVLPRDAPGRIFRVESETGSVMIDKGELLKLTQVANRKTKPRSATTLHPVEDGVRYLVGHCFAHCVGIIIRSSLGRVGFRKSISADHIKDIAVHTFDECLQKNNGNEIAIFHQRQCSLVTA